MSPTALIASHNPLNDLSDIAVSLPRLPTSSRRLSSANQARRRRDDATAAAAVALLPRTSPLDTPSALTLSLRQNKKKGQTFKCESCAKVYRHPSCLVKHRWEHSPHWREASKFLLSKHQQVQLLEAAAILSHIAPPIPRHQRAKSTSPISSSGSSSYSTSSTAVSLSSDSTLHINSTEDDSEAIEGDYSCGTSLPEDRSLWPYFVSGGALPLPYTTTSGIPLGLSTSLPSPYSTGDVDDDVEIVEDIDIEGEEEDGREKVTVPPSKEPSSPPSDEIVGMQTRSRSRPIAQSQVLPAPSKVFTMAPDAKIKAKTPAVAPIHSPSPSYAIIESRSMGPAVPPLSIGLSVPHSSSVRYHARQHSLAPSSSVDEDEEDEERGLRDDDEETVDGSEEWEYHGGMAMDMDL